MKPFFFLLCTALAGSSSAQTIYLNNASLEGMPGDATMPAGWFGCELGTTPDLLPGYWGVHQEAAEGETFVGIITREDGSWESIGQRLPDKIAAGDCYSFSLELSHSNNYETYNGPLKLRIWGGAQKCGKQQLLFESPFIEKTYWETYQVEFTAEKDINYLTFEAFYREKRFSYRGNVLVDNISGLEKCKRAMLAP